MSKVPLEAGFVNCVQFEKVPTPVKLQIKQGNSGDLELFPLFVARPGDAEIPLMMPLPMIGSTLEFMRSDPAYRERAKKGKANPNR